MEKKISAELQHLAEIEGLQRDYDAAEAAFEDAKAHAAGLKRLCEKKALALSQFIRALSASMPLFDEIDDEV